MEFETKRIAYAALYPILFLILLSLIQVTDVLTGAEFFRYGNFPLDPAGLYGVLLQPLLHSGFEHLLSNAFPVFVLMWSLFYFYGDISFGVMVRIWIGSGAITWLIGRPYYHVGASGLIYGLLFFLFFSGIFRRIRELMALSVLLVFLYGSIIWGMLPIAEYIQPDLSWEGHLSGAVAGLITAVYYRNHPPHKKEVLFVEDDDFPDDSSDAEPLKTNDEDN